ncbi:stress response translation initiation inhibitor YciH [archaeon]|nr:stress response translation initiation inhibitor YciH [archaeon]|tara:strand:- start:110 stop:424 length:315 start_codon:yes stop_codon:yes gene_type:complete
MANTCPKCGLNLELCVCETIAKEGQQIKIYTVKKRFGKLSTMVEGIDSKDINLKDLAKKLKSKFACGGTVKNNIIELQGDHVNKIKEELVQLGFAENTINVNRR